MKRTMVVLLVLILTCGFTFGKAQLGLNSVGGKLGFVMPEDHIDNTFGLGVDADFGKLTDNIYLCGEALFWSKSNEHGLGEWTWTVFEIGSYAKYYFPVDAPFKLYGAAGLGLTFTKTKSEWDAYESQYNSVAGGDHSETDTDIGINLMLGGEKKINEKLSAYGQLRYHLDGVDYFGIYGGVIFGL